jgi:hypothetical protein
MSVNVGMDQPSSNYGSSMPAGVLRIAVVISGRVCVVKASSNDVPFCIPGTPSVRAVFGLVTVRGLLIATSGVR